MQKADNLNGIFVSTACLDTQNRRLDCVLETYHRMGLRKIEISAPHPYMPLADLERLISRYQNLGIDFIFHNYFPTPEKSIVLNMISRDPEKQNSSRDMIKNASRIAQHVGVELYCFHPGYLRDGNEQKDGMFEFYGRSKQGLDEGLEYFMENFPAFYEDLKVENGHRQNFFIGLENLFPSPNGSDQSIFCKSDDIVRVFESPKFKDSNIGILIDLAHLTISSNLYRFDREKYLELVIDRYGDRIYEIHLSENDAIHDSHKPLRSDSWAMSVLRKFRRTGSRLNGKKTKICLESRKMSERDILDNLELINSHL